MNYEFFKKTIFLDIDGCIFKHKGDLYSCIDNLKPDVLPGVLYKLAEWEAAGHRIFITTGRKESLRKITEKQLANNLIVYDQLIMGLNRGERIVINDIKPYSNAKGMKVATGIELPRNQGLGNVDI